MKPIVGGRAPGYRAVRFELDPRTALHVVFHLMASVQAEETTMASRMTVAGLIPQLQRAVAATGVISLETLQQFQRHLLAKPAARPLDDVIRQLQP
ncbi:MAG: hypothetical protein LAO77_23105 [Acidobacteriia bacterium]|nr:hypothetical protein [Terriglobia bacterium]